MKYIGNGVYPNQSRKYYYDFTDLIYDLSEYAN
jgi:hypothetical protein